jgi:hypothetical protein
MRGPADRAKRDRTSGDEVGPLAEREPIEGVRSDTLELLESKRRVASGDLLVAAAVLLRR